MGSSSSSSRGRGREMCQGEWGEGAELGGSEALLACCHTLRALVVVCMVSSLKELCQRSEKSGSRCMNEGHPSCGIGSAGVGRYVCQKGKAHGNRHQNRSPL